MHPTAASVRPRPAIRKAKGGLNRAKNGAIAAASANDIACYIRAAGGGPTLTFGCPPLARHFRKTATRRRLSRMMARIPFPLVGSEGRGEPVARPGGGRARRGRIRGAGRNETCLDPAEGEAKNRCGQDEPGNTLGATHGLCSPPGLLSWRLRLWRDFGKLCSLGHLGVAWLRCTAKGSVCWSHMPGITQHQINHPQTPSVELFQVGPDHAKPTGAMLFVHGNQGGRRIGARETVETGLLLNFCTRLNITAAAVSQPGYGGSEGPPDFCGPATQRAIRSALSFLRAQPNIDPGKIVLHGHSRGAIASAMVATQDANLRAVILSAGVYDLEAFYHVASPGIRWSIEKEAGASDAMFAARSSLRHAGKMRCETLLLHGRHDDRAPVTQAEQLAKALCDAGTTVSLHVFDCGHRIPHELSRAAMRPFLREVFAPDQGPEREKARH